jgi:hypothetical protein
MSNSALYPPHKNIEIIKLHFTAEFRDYRDAIHISNRVAENKLSAYMLLSWHDRDRDFASPQHSSGRHSTSAVPGYVDYGIHHGATLKVDIEDGRFVFFYLPANL